MVITGIIRPPPEIRAVADRTALYVAKNGRTFEQRILASEKGKTPKFAFLHLSSPFHAYYEDRIQFYIDGGDEENNTKEGEEDGKKSDNNKQTNETKNGTTTTTSADDGSKQQQQQAQQQQQQKQKTASVIDPIAKALLNQRSKISQLQASIDEEIESQKKNDNEIKVSSSSSLTIIPPPPPFHYVNIIAPASLSVVQIETIQLVAQFVALDGKGGSFLQQLTYREWNNPTYAFCQPRHGHFPYFTALVDAYRRIIQQLTATTTTPNNNGNNNIYNDPTSPTEQVQKMANNIDTCLEVTAYRAEYERHIEEQIRKRQEDGDIVEPIAKIDWHDFVVVETIDFPPDENVELSMLPPPPPPPVPVETKVTQTTTTGATANDDMDESDDDDEPIRVVPTYTPRIVSTHETNKVDTVIDPITGKSVPVKDMPEHMRIQLLDPKWAEERKKFQEKQKESNLVSGDIIAANLQRFAQARGGGGGSSKQEQDDQSKKRPLGKSSEQGIGPTFPIPPPPPPQEHGGKRQRVDAYSMGGLDSSSMLPPPPPPPPMPPSSSTLPPRPQGLVLPPVRDVPPAPTSTYNEDPFAAAATAALPIPSSTTPTSAAGSGELMSESDFVATLNKTAFTIQIRVPNDSSQMAWNFYGQIVSLNVDVMYDVKTVKMELSKAHLNGIAPNKIQLKNPVTGVFLKDALTLAALNVGPGTTLELVPRARGGKKK